MPTRRSDRRVTVHVGQLPDAPLIRQVVANLLSNAFKFTRGRDNALIEIDGRREAGECIYSVRDNGVGFDMRYAHRLFGVFQRFHAADEFEGTGIGLSIVQRILERHGGRIRAVGEVEKGATFTFTLPE